MAPAARSTQQLHQRRQRGRRSKQYTSRGVSGLQPCFAIAGRDVCPPCPLTNSACKAPLCCRNLHRHGMQITWLRMLRMNSILHPNDAEDVESEASDVGGGDVDEASVSWETPYGGALTPACLQAGLHTLGYPHHSCHHHPPFAA
jgi:hypothetical protein